MEAAEPMESVEEEVLLEENTLFEDVAETVEVEASVEADDADDDLDDELLEELLNAPDSGDEELDEDSELIETETSEGAIERETDEASKKKTAFDDKIVKLPLSRIKQIIKLDEDVDRVNGDAVFIIAKAAELFLQSFAKEIYKVTERSKKKTIQLRDVNTCIEEVMCMQFLEGCFVEEL